MNYFELYPGDYLRDTARLSLTEHGAYLKLMLCYYGEEQPLPEDYATLYQIAGAVSLADKAAVRKISTQFFPVGADGLRRKGRIDEEIAKARKRIDIARKNGSKNKSKIDPAGRPAGKPLDTQRDTRSGEALHTPHVKQELLLANANSQPAEIDPKAALWREWKRASGDTGALLGKLCKEHGDGAVLAAVATVLNERPADPKSFIVRLLSPNPGTAGRVDGYGYVLDKHGNRTQKRGAVI